MSITCLILAAGASTVRAEELVRDREMPRITLRGGLYDVDASTVIRVDGTLGFLGTTLNLERSLGVPDEQDTWFASGRFRLADRHFVEAEFFRLNRRGLKELSTDIEFGDRTYSFGATVRSFFGVDVTRLGYAYSLVRQKSWGLAASAGLHVTGIDSGLSEILTSGGAISATNVQIAKATAPLPVVGISGAVALGPRWALFGRGQIFRLQFDQTEGALDHFSISLENDLSNHFGWGIAYDYFEIDVRQRERLWRGHAKVRFQGPLIFAKLNF